MCNRSQAETLHVGTEWWEVGAHVLVLAKNEEILVLLFIASLFQLWNERFCFLPANRYRVVHKKWNVHALHRYMPSDGFRNDYCGHVEHLLISHMSTSAVDVTLALSLSFPVRGEDHCPSPLQKAPQASWIHRYSLVSPFLPPSLVTY